MQHSYSVADDFYPDAGVLRDAIDSHFAEPFRHEPGRHQVWNYWFVPGLYTYLRTLPEKVIGLELAQRFYGHLQRYAFETFGLGKVFWPFLSVYVAGCCQGVHNDAGNGRLGYVSSLTRWDRRNFAGGETVLFRDSAWTANETIAKPRAALNFFELIPSEFNRLLVFDDRVPHAVQRIEGTMDPRAGRIVMHGHFRESGISVEGALGGEQLHPAVASILAELKPRQERVSLGYHGLIVVRLEIGPGAKRAQVSTLFDRVLALSAGLPAFPSGELTDFLADWQFPPADSRTRITLPIRQK